MIVQMKDFLSNGTASQKVLVKPNLRAISPVDPVSLQYHPQRHQYTHTLEASSFNEANN